MHQPRRRALPLITALAAVILTVLLAAPLTSAGAEAPTGVAVIHLDGRGHGHGVGLSQWGAYTMATQGASAADILAQFYPGTTSATAAGEVVVVVDTRDRVVLRLPQGGQLRSHRDGQQAPGFPVQLQPGETAEIVHDGSGYRVRRGAVAALDSGDAQRFRPAQEDCVLLCEPEDDPEEPAPGEDEPEPGCVLCTTTTTTPQPAPAPAPGQPAPAPAPAEPEPQPAPSEPVSPTPVWAIPNAGGTVTSVDRGRTYRGSFEVVGGPGALRLRNHVDVEDYLKGMAEVPSSWPAAAVQAQTVAARTYALRAVAARGELCDSESCQVYVGVSRETAGQTAAVEATRGWILRYGSGLAATFYSASGGGHSATIQEGFGASYDIPYLPARPYPTANPKNWQLDVALRDVAARLGYPGTLTAVRVTATGPSGRPVAMVLDGDAGTVGVDPQDFRRRLGLQSTFFTVTAGVADEAPPPPPPPVEADQLSAEAAGADQLQAVVGSDDLPPRAERVERARQLASAPLTSSDPADGDPLAALLVGVTILAAAATALQVHRLGASAVADGVVQPVLGAPARGLPMPGAATMARWTSRNRSR